MTNHIYFYCFLYMCVRSYNIYIISEPRYFDFPCSSLCSHESKESREESGVLSIAFTKHLSTDFDRGQWMQQLQRNTSRNLLIAQIIPVG